MRQAIAYALKQSRKGPDEIAFVNAHGTGTLDNDRVEAVTLHEMLPGVPFLSTKGHTGHTLGAAGAIEAVLTMICLGEGPDTGERGFFRGRSRASPQIPTHP